MRNILFSKHKTIKTKELDDFLVTKKDALLNKDQVESIILEKKFCKL